MEGKLCPVRGGRRQPGGRSVPGALLLWPYPCPDAPLSRRTPVLNGSLLRRAPTSACLPAPASPASMRFCLDVPLARHISTPARPPASVRICPRHAPVLACPCSGARLFWWTSVPKRFLFWRAFALACLLLRRAPCLGAPLSWSTFCPGVPLLKRELPRGDDGHWGRESLIGPEGRPILAAARGGGSG